MDALANALERNPSQSGTDDAQRAATTVPGALETAFPGRLRWWMAGRGFGQRALARKLHLGHCTVNAWLSRGRFPKRAHWPAIVGAGIATESELLAWRPKRERRPHSAAYWVRGARVFILAEYAARATAESQSLDGAAVSSSKHRGSRPRRVGCVAGAPGAVTMSAGGVGCD